jgi:hypothetical protein
LKIAKIARNLISVWKFRSGPKRKGRSAHLGSIRQSLHGPMTSQAPACTLRRSDGETGHEHWLKSKNRSLLSPSKSLPQCTYTGGCHCQAVELEFATASILDSDTIFYTCVCNACFKRGYLFFVVPPKHFQFTSRLPSDLGTYATTTGMHPFRHQN